MIDTQKHCDALSNIAWGYLLLNLDIHLGHVSILPAFAGYALLLSAIRTLTEERRELALLVPLGQLLRAYYAVDWLLSWARQTLIGHFLFLDVLMTAAELYFHFQILTDIISLTENYPAEGKSLAERLRQLRNIHVILTTAVFLMTECAMSLPSSENIWNSGQTFFAPLLGIAAIMITVTLFQLRDVLRKEYRTAS